MFKLGDEVEVYNGVDTRVGKIVAVLNYPDNSYPLVVEHGAFGKKGLTAEEQAAELRVFQRFNQSGDRVERGHIKIRVPVKHYYLPIEGNYAFAGTWDTEETARAKIEKPGIKGFLRGEYNQATGKIENIVYTTLEK